MQQNWQDRRKKNHGRRMTLRRPDRGRPKTHDIFPGIALHLEEFLEPYRAQADNRRRKTVATLSEEKSTAAGGKDELGFSLTDLMDHLFEKIPGLYEHGFDIRTAHHQCSPLRFQTLAQHRTTTL